MESGAAVIERGAGRPESYRLADGTKVDGTTTVIGRFKDAGPLIHWGWQMGKAGLNLYEKRDKAGDVGGYAHDMVECFIHGKPLPVVPEEYAAPCASAYGAFREWYDGARMVIVATEIPLVSEQYRYGGTIDAVARDARGRLCLLDWKSSGGIYTDYALQLAAYRQLWNENRPHMLITDGGYHICRFAKEHGDFEHRYFPDLTDAWEMFKLLVPAYALDKKLKARIK